MSFDVFLQRSVAGKPAQVDREAVLAVLKTAKFNGPDDFGFYIVEFPEGGDVEFSAEGLQGSGDFADCAFHLGGISRHLVKFMFEVAKAGDMFILPAMEDFVPILTRAEQRVELPPELAENYPEPVLCESAEELESLLSGGYNGWKKYRDKVLRENRGV
jgi:hypothetical protein